MWLMDRTAGLNLIRLTLNLEVFEMAFSYSNLERWYSTIFTYKKFIVMGIIRMKNDCL